MTANATQMELGLFDGATVVYEITREMLLEDGALIDVSETAREAGWRFPVAVTAGLWADINAIPASKSWQDVQGRLWDVLWMGSLAARKLDGDRMCYRLIMHVGRSSYYTVKAVIGAASSTDPRPVVTLMKPNED